MTPREALEYEVRASWWARYLSAHWMQELAARYFGWKVRRKYGRYRESIRIGKLLKQQEGGAK